jgi:hypothetical protein
MSMWNVNARVEKLDAHGRRIIAVSDIHANMPYFKGLLEKINFSDSDELIIDGDFLEKGKNSLETLRFIMNLSSHGNCHAICGNCDTWADVLDSERRYWAPRIVNYMLDKQGGLIWDMLGELGVEITPELDFQAHIPELSERFAPEWDFLHGLPHVIETEHYIFVHGGIKPDIPIERQLGGDCMKFDDFMTYGYSFDKWVIVGHWPVMLYLPDRVCANPIIDRQHRVISIDGGCSLKDDGQLNALIIPCEGSEDFSFEAYDPFPVRTVKTAQHGGDKSYYIRWGDNDVQVLHRGREFSLVRHVRTGYEMEVLTKYLYSEEEFCKCNDSTDLVLELKVGDKVGVVEETSRGCLVKHNGTSGWYWGELI